MRFIRDGITSSGQESGFLQNNNHNQDRCTEIIQNHTVYLKAIAKENHFDKIKELLRNKNKDKMITLSFEGLFYNKKRKRYGTQIIINVEEKNNNVLKIKNNRHDNVINTNNNETTIISILIMNKKMKFVKKLKILFLNLY